MWGEKWGELIWGGSPYCCRSSSFWAMGFIGPWFYLRCVRCLRKQEPRRAHCTVRIGITGSGHFSDSGHPTAHLY